MLFTTIYQKWSPRGRTWPRGRPRGHILKSLALALVSKVKSLALALRPQVLKSSKIGLSSARGQHYFFNCYNFVERLKNFWKTFFCADRLKNFCEDFFFFGEHLRLCPWSLALASSIPVLGLESVCPRKGCPWPWPRIFFVSLALALSLVSSTPPLLFTPLHIIPIILTSHFGSFNFKLFHSDGFAFLFLVLDEVFVSIAGCFYTGSAANYHYRIVAMQSQLIILVVRKY